jgi:uncharacterized protein HemX
MIGLLTNKYTIFGIIGLGMGLALFVQTMRANSAEKQAEASEQSAAQWKQYADNMELTARENAATIDKLRAENERIAKINAENVQKAQSLSRKYEALRKQTNDDTPVDPNSWWCAILNELRSMQGGDGPACSRPN